MIIKAGIVETVMTRTPPIAAFPAFSMVARRAVTTAARMTAVGPLGQAETIQKVPTRMMASVARNPAHAAETMSVAVLATRGRGFGAAWETAASYASA